MSGRQFGWWISGVVIRTNSGLVHCFRATTNKLPICDPVKSSVQHRQVRDSALNFDQAEAVRNCFKFVPSLWMTSRRSGVVSAGCWMRIPRCASSAKPPMG